MRSFRPSRTVWIAIALVGLIVVAGAWYYHVPVAEDLPVEDSWKILRKDWYGVMFTHVRYYRYEAPGTPEEVSARVRDLLNRAGPWEDATDESEAEAVHAVRTRLAGREGRPIDDSEIVRMARDRLRCGYDRGRGIENPNGCFVVRRMRHSEGRSAFRIVHVLVSAGPSGTSIVEIWDVDRFDH